MNKQKNTKKTKEKTNIPSNPQKMRAFKSKQKDRSFNLGR